MPKFIYFKGVIGKTSCLPWVMLLSYRMFKLISFSHIRIRVVSVVLVLKKESCIVAISMFIL